MADEKVECCGSCRFWLARPDNKEGLCRRRRPTPVATGITQNVLGQPAVMSTGLFPPTRPDVWCGEFEWPVGVSMSIDSRLTAPVEGAA